MMKSLLLTYLFAAFAIYSTGAAAIDSSATSSSSSSVSAESDEHVDTSLPRLYDNRIVGGNPVHISLYPHQVSLRYKSIFNSTNLAHGHRCGGVLYSSNVVITAAHCTIAVVASQYHVVAGTINRRGSDGYILPVKEIIQHENYNPNTFDNDIALLILDSPMPTNNFTVKPIELIETAPGNGAKSIVTGWGTTSEGGISSDLLQEVLVPIVSNELCNVDYEGDITDSMLCAGVRGQGGKDACQGDSGGPLLVDGKLAGIVSWGYGCARPDYPGVYANVAYLRPWILKNIPAQTNA